jgi:hypothetical protein
MTFLFSEAISRQPERSVGSLSFTVSRKANCDHDCVCNPGKSSSNLGYQLLFLRYRDTKASTEVGTLHTLQPRSDVRRLASALPTARLPTRHTERMPPPPR